MPVRLPGLLVLLFPVFAVAQEKILSTVEVTATADDVTERRQAATQKVIIGTKDIENMGAMTVSDVMSKLPGVDAGTPGADGSMAMRARGMTRDSVQIFIDGERVAGNARMAQAMIGRLPATELDRVEIVRGASAEFGGSAPVSVNLVLKKARSKESTALKAALGFRNSEPNAQFSLSRGGGDKEFSWMIPLTVNRHGMPSGRHLERQDSTGTNQVDDDKGRTNINEFVFSPRFIWKSGSDSLTLSPSLFRAFGHRVGDMSRTDIATPANGSTRRDDEYNRTGFNRFRADGEAVRDGTKYSGRLAWSQGERHADVRRNSVTLAGVATLSTEQTARRERDLGGALRIDRPFGQHLLAAAIEQNGHRRDDKLTSTAATESHNGWDRQWTAWVQDEWSPDSKLTLTGGLRGEFIRYAADDAEQSHQRWLPSVAVRWEPAEHWVARSSLGAGIKPPKLEEVISQPVFSVGANTPLEADRRGNPNLKPERSVNFEAVLERYLPNEMGVAGINFYLRHTEDFTERRVALEGARWVDRPYNEGTARHWGFEIDGKLRADQIGWKGATFRAHLTLPKSRVADQRLGITRQARETPRYQLSGGYDQTLGGDWSYGASFQHFGRVRTDVTGEQNYVTRDRTLVDAYTVRRLAPGVNLRLTLQNLFKADTRRQQDAYSGAASWSLTPVDRGVRTIMLALEGKW